MFGFAIHQPSHRSADTTARRSNLALLLAVPALAACQFSASVGGPDYEKLERGITDELNGNYAEISRQVSSVSCPRQSTPPKTGDTFICTADVEGHEVRVEVAVKDDDYNVDFSTLDVVFDLAGTERGLSREISDQYGFDVKVACGEGLKVVAIGDSFECVATDPAGDTRTVRLTAGGVDENDRWEMVE
jgi:uncharacterized protein DUF4333